MKNLLLITYLFFTASFVVTAQNVPTQRLPKMKQASKAIYVAISNDTPEAKHSSRILQGIVNRDEAELFLANDNKEVDWFRYLNHPYGRPDKVFTTGTDRGLRTLFNHYKDRIDKLVVCNFITNDYTFNVAVNMASVENALPVSEKLKNALIEEFGWDKEIVDIRNQWSSATEAYDWALENLMPKMNKQIVFSTGLRDDWRNGGWAIYDYAVASRSFTFWLDDETAAGKSIIKKILNTPGYPKNSYVFGYGMHGDDLNLTTNPEGFGFLVSDLFPNGSFYSSFPSETYTQREPKAVDAENGKIYVALHWSDGDNIQFNHNASLDIFRQEARGAIPASMTLSPALVDIAPFILKYYYENATENDEFIGGPSGVQYIQEPYYKPMDYNDWCQMNGEWLAESGMYTTASSLRWPAQPFYNNGFLKTGVAGTLAWTNGNYQDAYNWFGMPVVGTGGVVSDERGLYNYLAGLNGFNERPAFTGVYLVQAGFGSAGYAGMKRVADQLEQEFPGKYVFLTASDLMETFKRYSEKMHVPYKNHLIPGRIEAEDFDEGGQGIGFYDTATTNQGGEYRNEAGDYVGIGKEDFGYYVGWTNKGEWLNYTVNIEEEGGYDIVLRYSTNASSGRSVCLMLDDTVLSTVELMPSNGLSNYQDQTVKVNLPAGEYNFRVQFGSGGINLDYVDFIKEDHIVPTISSDKLYKITAKHSDKVLALQKDESTQGVYIVQQTFTDSDHQLWRICLVGDAYYSLESASTGMAMTIRGNSNIQQYPFDCTIDNCKWSLIYKGESDFHITPKGYLEILEISEASHNENAALKLSNDREEGHRLFTIEEVRDYNSIKTYEPEVQSTLPYPNPFVDGVYIPISLSDGETITLTIYSIDGTPVYTARYSGNENLTEVYWDGCTIGGNNVASGIYIYQLNSKSLTKSGRLIKK